MPSEDLLIAANTIWVVVAAVLVMFMQAGFAFLEAGLTRMKNAAHIAGKNVLIFGICWTSPIEKVTHNRTGRSLEEVEVA